MPTIVLRLGSSDLPASDARKLIGQHIVLKADKVWERESRGPGLGAEFGASYCLADDDGGDAAVDSALQTIMHMRAGLTALRAAMFAIEVDVAIYHDETTPSGVTFPPRLLHELASLGIGLCVSSYIVADGCGSDREKG